MPDKKQKATQATPRTDSSPLAPNTTFELSLPWSELAPVYTKTLNKLAKKIKLPGFRPGMVPTKLAEEQIGHDALIEETLRQVLPDKYTDVIKKNQYLPLTDPEFSAKTHLHKEEDWTIVVQIAQKPKIELKDYKKVVAQAGRQAQSDWTKQQKIDASQAKKTKTADRTTAEKPDPEQEKQKAARAEKEFILNAVFTALIKSAAVQIPELLVKHEARHQLEDLARQLKQYNLSIEQYLTRQNITFDQLTNSMATQAVTQLQLSFILDEIRHLAKIEVSPAEVDQVVQSADDHTQNQAKNPYVRQSIERSLISHKLEDHLLSLLSKSGQIDKK